jgi:glycine/D-amino acid oxidase-like deaminating enzyme
MTEQMYQTDRADAPESSAPAPRLVRAARTHLTSRFARAAERLLWEEHQAPLPDTEAAEAAVSAAEQGQATGPDIAAALVVAQAARLDADRLAYRVWQAAEQAGLSPEQIAAVLELPSPEEAVRHRDWLRVRASLPTDSIDGPTMRRRTTADRRPHRA